MRHPDITGAQAVHPAAYIQNTDPGAIGPNKFWVDTSTTPYTLKLRNAGDSGWDTIGDAVGLPIGITDGGTGHTTATAGFDALAPATPAKGDIIVYNGTHWVKIAAGADTYALTAKSAATDGVDWEAVGHVDGPGSSVVGHIATFNDTSGKILSDSGVSLPLSVANGGTGDTSLPAHNLLVGEGTGGVGSLAPGAARNAAISDGTDWASRALVAADLPTIPVAGGGTGQTTATTAFDALAPATPAKGDLLVYNGTHWVKITAGANGTVLTANSAATDGVEWDAVTSESADYYQTVQVGGTPQTQRSKLDFIAGTNVTITPADDAGGDRTKITIDASGGGGSITIEEIDGTPTIASVTTIKVTNGTLTDLGGGVAQLDTGGSGGSSPVNTTKKTIQTRTTLYDNTLGVDGNWDVSSIDQTYDELLIVFHGRLTSASPNILKYALNNDTSDANYSTLQLDANTTPTVDSIFYPQSDGNARRIGIAPGADTPNQFGSMEIKIKGYAGTAKYKDVTVDMGAPGSAQYRTFYLSTWYSASAINRFALASGSGSILAGSRLQIIGIKDEQVVTDVSGAAAPVTVVTEDIQVRVPLYDNTLGSDGAWDVSGIDQTYDHLEILFWGQADNTGDDRAWANIHFNNDTTDADYNTVRFESGTATVDSVVNAPHVGIIPGADSTNHVSGTVSLLIQNYANSTVRKVAQGLSQDTSYTYPSGGSLNAFLPLLYWNSVAAINRIAFFAEGASFKVGSRLQIIGIKTQSMVKSVTGGGVSPLTTKGDLYGFGTADDRLPVNTDGKVLTADSGASLGVSWQTPGSGFSGSGNQVVASPDGSSGSSVLRALVLADLPDTIADSVPLLSGTSNTLSASGAENDDFPAGSITYNPRGSYFSFKPSGSGTLDQFTIKFKANFGTPTLGVNWTIQGDIDGTGHTAPNGVVLASGSFTPTPSAINTVNVVSGPTVSSANFYWITIDPVNTGMGNGNYYSMASTTPNAYPTGRVIDNRNGTLVVFDENLTFTVTVGGSPPYYGPFQVPCAGGTATLASGTVTVSDSHVKSNSIILLTAQETGTLTGFLRVSARVAGTSFTISSSVGTDTANVAWIIINP